MRQPLVLLILLVLTGQKTLAQEAPAYSQQLVQAEDSLKFYLDSTRKARTEKSIFYWNNKFRHKLEKTLELEGAFDYPFDKLTTIGKMVSPDKYFRIFNWNVERPDVTQSYFGYILVPSNRHDKVIELLDRSEGIEKPETQMLNNQRWYGCLYYKIIPTSKKGKGVYTLLGFDMNNRATKKRIIEVLSFSGDKANFGAPIFDYNDKTARKRVVFEYSAEVQMALRWEPENERIVFDHLEPSNKDAEGLYEFYYPDGSYDVLELVEGRWLFKPQVVVGNEKDKMDKFFNLPPPPPDIRIPKP